MSSNYERLKDFFMQRFPEANEKILELVANNRIKSANLMKINDSDCQELINFFGTLTADDLNKLVFNALPIKS